MEDGAEEKGRLSMKTLLCGTGNHSGWHGRLAPSRRATGPAEARMRLLAKALGYSYSPSLSVPVGESPTSTGTAFAEATCGQGAPVPPRQSSAGYELSRMIRRCHSLGVELAPSSRGSGVAAWPGVAGGQSAALSTFQL